MTGDLRIAIVYVVCVLLYRNSPVGGDYSEIRTSLDASAVGDDE